MTDSLLETFRKRSVATIANLGVALTCAIPGATRAIEEPVMDVIDLGTMATGGVLEAEGRAGWLTQAAKHMGADDKQYEGKGELEDACEGGKFLGATVTAVATGGLAIKAVKKLGGDAIKAKLREEFKREVKHELEHPEASGARKMAGWVQDKAVAGIVGTVLPAAASGAAVVAKEYYRETHPGPELQSPM